MVNTGYISFITESGGGFDADGNALAPTKTFSNDIQCNLKVVTKELKFITDGQYVQAKYSIYIDRDKVSLDVQTINEVRLKDSEGNSLGNHQIHNREYLQLVNQIKIIV